MTELREKMIKAMELRNFSPRTHTAYLCAVTNLAKHYKKSPEGISQEEVENYLLYLKKERKLSFSTRNQAISGLKFFFNETIKNPDMQLQLPRKKTPVKLPEVLSVDEVNRVINAPSNVKHRVILMTAYSAGLRVSELVRLEPRHIVSSRMLILVEDGKGVKDRYTILSKTLLENLRQYWQSYRPTKWLQARKAELLPVIYFHSVFTLPHEFNPVILCNKKLMLTILFKATSQTLQALGQNPDNGLGGKIGFIALLHTWDQKLRDHFHLHCLIPGGALAADKGAWIRCSNDYLFAQSALSRVFRGKFMAYFTQAYENGELIFAGAGEKLGTKSGFKQLKAKLWAKNWVVDIADPIDRPENVLEYVGRYTHRVAISNDRIISLKDGMVTFAYKNRETKKMQTMTLEAVEFIRRFLLHVLPKGFMRIRHYGFLANRCKRDNLSKCRHLLDVSQGFCEAEEKSIQQLMLELTGVDITQCPKCKKGTMQKRFDLPKRFGQNPFYLIHPEEFKDTG